MADFGCGVGNVKAFLRCNNALPERFINIDANKNMHPDIIADVCVSSGLQSGSLDFISCLDLAQNVPIEKRKLLYGEIDRVLKIGGVVYSFFRNDLHNADLENKEHHIFGASVDDFFPIFLDYEILSWWGVNSTVHNKEWPRFFPFEFNRIFYSVKDLENSKFHGIILRKIND